MNPANIEIDSGAEASVRLVTFAIVPRMLAYLSRLDITDRITFTERTVVGAGAFGDISIGNCNINRRRKVNVAVKRLRLHLKDDIKLLLEKEVYVWSKLNHQNVLPLLGYAFDKDTGYPMLISEWMDNGSAWTYVTKNPQCNFLRLVTGVARGLAYLHENDVIHSDIKSDNVLVSNTGDALLCDFGFSRMLNASRSLGSMSVGGEGTPQYMAYELLAHPTTCTKASKKTDVWAFGVTIYELYTRKRPYEEVSRYQVPFRIMQGELLEFPDVPVNPHTTKLTELLRSICARCWILEPSKRTRMTELVNILELEQPRQDSNSAPTTSEAPSLSDSSMNDKRSADSNYRMQQQQKLQSKRQELEPVSNDQLPFSNLMQAQPNANSMHTQNSMPEENGLGIPGASPGSNQSNDLPGQQRPQLNPQPLQLQYMLQNLRKPTMESGKQALLIMEQMKVDISKERTFRFGHVKQLPETEKGAFAESFETTCNVLREMCRFLHLYLASTSDIYTVRGIFIMLDLCDTQRYLLQTANPVYVLDVATLQKVLKQCEEIKTRVYLVLQRLRIMMNQVSVP